MKKIDYIIVGGGYAGLFFAHQLIKTQKSFLLISDRKESASEISAGIISPAVLKRFTTFWLAQEQLDCLQNTLSEIENYTHKNYFIPHTVRRIFHDETEKKLWLKKAIDPSLKAFFNPSFSGYEEITNPFGTGEVLQSGRLEVRAFFTDLYRYLTENDNLLNETFEFNHLNPQKNLYKDYIFSHIIFCEGIKVKENPYFPKLPLIPNKGFHLTVQLSKPFEYPVILKKKHFLFHLENNLYYYGGTYARESEDHYNDDHYAIETLKSGLLEIYPYPYDIIKIEVGIRPTTHDRRPILGNHSQFRNLHILNGLGARGILNGCYFAKKLFDSIESGMEFSPEVNVNRFY